MGIKIRKEWVSEIFANRLNELVEANSLRLGRKVGKAEITQAMGMSGFNIIIPDERKRRVR